MGAIFLPGPNVVRGQDLDGAAIHYGDGVHAYFRGNSSRAEESLSSAMSLDSQDPRIYYFRALSLLLQGRMAEARGDMQGGAALEAQRPGRFAVGAALERVQGRDRLLIEQYRRQARLDATGGAVASGTNPPISQPAGLRQRVVIPLDQYLRPGTPSSIRPSGVDLAVPRTFAPTQPAAPASRGNSQRAPEGQEDPFRDDPTPPAEKTPVVPPPPAATNPPATAAPATSEGGDPFSTP
jgi:hypothetical protein